MTLQTKALPRLARTAFLAVLMTSVAGAALAAPSARDAKLAAMQQQLDTLRAQMEQMKAANGADDRLSAIQAQLDAFGQQLADIKTQQTTANADIITLKAPPSGATVTPTLPNGKPALATADGRFTANIRAIVMFDAGAYLQKSNLPATITGAARDLNDGTNFRRARFGIDGKLFKDFDYALIYEFGGSGAEDAGHIQEAWAQYTALKPWRIRLGAFEPNIGLAAAVSTSQMPLLERPAAAEIARNVAAGDSRSALQVAGNGVFGEGDSGIATRWFVSVAATGNTVTTFNSAASSFNQQPFGEQQAVIGRIALAPFQSTDWQTHFGVNAQYVLHASDATGGAAPRYPVQLRDRPELRIDGTRLVDTGGIDARHVRVLGAEAGANYRNFLIEGEYFDFDIKRRNTTPVALGDPRFHGWYAQGVWVLTGETRPYNPAEARFDAPKMNYNFNPAAGTWGAWEVAARYSVIDLDWKPGIAGSAKSAEGIRGGEQKIASVGLNWYLNPDIRFMLDYQHVQIDRLNAAGANIGQDYNAVALRSQLTF
ncbi:MAG: porin [Asticcacaulis sp.]|nr:porin [Asticcacaulis sp.]